MSRQPPPPATIAIGLVTAVPGLFTFFCPSPMDVADHDQAAVKFQQAKAGVASLALGAAGSWACRAPWPFLLALLMVGLVMWEYRSAPKGEA